MTPDPSRFAARTGEVRASRKPERRHATPSVDDWHPLREVFVIAYKHQTATVSPLPRRNVGEYVYDWLGDVRGFEPPGSPAACADPVRLTCPRERTTVRRRLIGGEPSRPRLGEIVCAVVHVEEPQVSARGRQSQEVQLRPGFVAAVGNALGSEAEDGCLSHPSIPSEQQPPGLVPCSGPVDCVCFPMPTSRIGLASCY